MAIDTPLDSNFGKLSLLYKEEVEQLSDGSLTIEIYENGILGSSEELISTIGNDANASDIILAPISVLAEAGCEQTSKIKTLFANHKDFSTWAISKETEALFAEPNKCGVGAEGLFFCEDGFNRLFLADDNTPMQGKMIAGRASDSSRLYIESLGCIYTYLPAIDIKTAIEKGEIEGVERDYHFYKDNELWDETPYIVDGLHLVTPYEALIKISTLETLSSNDLLLLRKAGKNVITHFENMIAEEDASLENEFKDHGAVFAPLKE